jgi:dephospho-CoA kinase
VSRIAVIGGIGSGKTAVTDHLAERGAVVIDADVVARDVVGIGRPAWHQLVDAFGTAVLAPDGSLDRPFVADVVFHDATALRRLNHITHSAIGLEMAHQIERGATAPLIVVALPLFRPQHRDLLGLDEVWCVWAPPEVALERLVSSRGFRHEDAEARLASQPTNEERLRMADVALENTGSLEELRRKVDGLLAERGLLGG